MNDSRFDKCERCGSDYAGSDGLCRPCRIAERQEYAREEAASEEAEAEEEEE